MFEAPSNAFFTQFSITRHVMFKNSIKLNRDYLVVDKHIPMLGLPLLLLFSTDAYKHQDVGHNLIYQWCCSLAQKKFPRFTSLTISVCISSLMIFMGFFFTCQLAWDTTWLTLTLIIQFFLLLFKSRFSSNA